DHGVMRMALNDPRLGQRAIVSVETDGGRYPSVSAHHAPALRLERAMRDLYAVQPTGLPDSRPWLDHGKWPRREGGARYPVLPSAGEGLHQITVGPVHAGVIEPGHLPLTPHGGTVVRLGEPPGHVPNGGG